MGRILEAVTRIFRPGAGWKTRPAISGKSDRKGRTRCRSAGTPGNLTFQYAIWGPRNFVADPTTPMRRVGSLASPGQRAGASERLHDPLTEDCSPGTGRRSIILQGTFTRGKTGPAETTTRSGSRLAVSTSDPAQAEGFKDEPTGSNSSPRTLRTPVPTPAVA